MDAVIHNILSMGTIPPILLLYAVVVVPLAVLTVLWRDESELLTKSFGATLFVASAVPAVIYLLLNGHDVAWRYEDILPAQVAYPVLVTLAVLSVAAVVFSVTDKRKRRHTEQ
ncbi:MAG: hypothetical protein H6797_04085 [Candidatus Nomurabacteria bacterium]|nr:MAG: hypothetical protein H6797_04085 [Candidatus Nomurabacteria bacterium]